MNETDENNTALGSFSPYNIALGNRLLMQPRLHRYSFLLFCALALGAQAAHAVDPTIEVDAGSTSHTISPLLFGDQIQWPAFGQDFLKTDDGTTFSIRTDLIEQLKPLGLTVMRYPGGTLSDYFHWSQSTGPYGGRIAQYTLDSSAGVRQTQIPFFGPDEFADVAQRMGAQMMITTNVGTGTASEAATWLTYYKSKGITPTYWEIGNEVYADDSGQPTPHVQMTALQYIAAFNAQAAALRAIDPTIKIGAILCGFGTCGTWNQDIISQVTQRADFLSIHNVYAPAVQDAAGAQPASKVYKALLAAPQQFQADFTSLTNLIQTHGTSFTRNATLAVTEHAPFFLPPVGATDFVNEVIPALARNQTLGSALFSALTFHVFLRTSSIGIANHINPVSPYWQAPLTLKYPFDGPGYPVHYDPQGIPSAYYYVQQWYREAGGGTWVSSQVSNAPTFDSESYGAIQATTGTSALDVAAVRRDAGHVNAYVINRDLTRTITTTIRLTGLNETEAVQRVSQRRLTAPQVTSYNTTASPTVVQISQGAAPAQSSFTADLPPYSLTVYTFELIPNVNLDHVQVFPNPLRPAKGHTRMTFAALPPTASIRIYTLAGEKIRALTAGADGSVTWDGTNSSGQKTASGIYLAHIEAAGDKRTVKIAIQR